MKTIEEVISEVDTHKIYPEMVDFINEVTRLGDVTGDQASTYENKYHLITPKATKLLGDLERQVAYLERLREDTMNDLKAVSEEKSEAAKERDAKCDDRWRTVADDYAIAKVVFNKVNLLKKFFDGGVYVMRSRQANQKKDWHSTPTSEA